MRILTGNQEVDVSGYSVPERILMVLADGMPHSKLELKRCLKDDLAPPEAIRFHITNLRKLLEPRGETIVCEFKNTGFYYRHVRLLANAYSGKK